MKKITRLLAIMVALFSVGVATISAKQQSTTTLVPSYFVNESFTGAIAYPTSWAAGTALYASSGSVSWTAPAVDQLNTLGSGSGNRGITITFPTSGAETSVYVSFDWDITTQAIGQKNTIGLILHGSGATTTDPKNILGLYNCGSGGFFYCWNLEKDSTTFTTGGTFNRASGASTTLTSTRNAGSNTNFALATSTWYNIKAKLNFTTHVIDSLTITKKSDNTKITFTNLSFINSTASDISEITSFGTKSSNAGNGGNSGFAYSIDNFQTYKLIEAATANVTINYLDPSNTAFKTPNVVTNQAVGSIYTAQPTDKATYSDGSFYYIYDAASTIADNVAVAADGSSVINLKFKKVAVQAGTYSWTGITNSNWNDADSNFTTDGINSLGFQINNNVIFPGTALNKIVTVNNTLNLGTGSVSLNSTGYSLTGNGTLNGTGALNINLLGSDAVTLGLLNNLTGATQISGGSITVTKAGALGSSLVVNGPTVIVSNYAIPAATFNASAEIQSTAATSIPEMSTVFGSKVTITSTFNTLNGAYAFGFTPTGTFSGELELNGTGTDTKYGMKAVSPTYLANAKLTLKGTAFLYIDATQSAASTISIGTLSGESGARLGWGKGTATNDITWSVGALNENSTYAGTISNTGGYNSGGSFYTGAMTNFIKEGTGTLTLSGTANSHNGNFTVNNGNLNVTGTIGNATSVVTVAAVTGAKLSGNGTIGGATTVNGTLEGKLSFGSSLTLAGTTNLTGTGFDAGSFDVINIAGAVVNGGTLNVNIVAAEPTGPVTIKLINAGSYSGAFTTVKVTPAATSSSAWGYNNATGELTYYPLGTVTQTLKSNMSVYPTITNNSIQVSGQNISAINIVNLMGQSVKQINTTATTNTINLSGLSTGAYYVKVKSTDGSVTVSKIIYQK